MLNFINSIPENVGWVIVGAVGMLTVLMAIKVGKIIAIAIKERIEEIKVIADCDTPDTPDGDFR